MVDIMTSEWSQWSKCTLEENFATKQNEKNVYSIYYPHLKQWA